MLKERGEVQSLALTILCAVLHSDTSAASGLLLNNGLGELSPVLTNFYHLHSQDTVDSTGQSDLVCDSLSVLPDLVRIIFSLVCTQTFTCLNGQCIPFASIASVCYSFNVLRN